jgi:hypothetical protein
MGFEAFNLIKSFYGGSRVSVFAKRAPLAAGGIGHFKIQKIKKTLDITYKLWFNLFLKHASYVLAEK